MIDEKKLIEERPEWLNPDCAGNEEYNKGWNACNKYWCNTIKRQPKVGEWIPCSERLPEKHVDVLVDFGDENPIIAWYSHVNDTWKNSSTDYVINVDVIAWMSLPEPYKQVEE